MCLMPSNGASLCPPTEKAVKFANVFKILMIVHLAVAVLQLVDVDWSDSLFCLFGACCGYMAIRNPEGYQIQQIFCYIFLIGLQDIFKVVHLIMWIADVESSGDPQNPRQEPPPKWRVNFVHPANLICSTLLYTVGVWVAYVIYEELRRFINEGHDLTIGGGQFPGGGQAAGGQSGRFHPPSNPGANPYEERSAPPPSNTSGFTPFSGKGYTLV